MSQIQYSFFEDQQGPIYPQPQNPPNQNPLNTDPFFLQQMHTPPRDIQQQFDQSSPVQGFQQFPQNNAQVNSDTKEPEKNDSRNTRLVLLRATLEDIQKQVTKALELVKEELATPSVFAISEISQAQTVTKKEVEVSQGTPFSSFSQQPSSQQQYQRSPNMYDLSESYGQTKILEGVFDGQHMIGPDGKQYTIPANYASKSKLVEGDILKLTMSQQGSFMFKQIGPIERIRIVGTIGQDSLTRDYYAYVGERKWRILTASITYYKGLPGDEIVILVPREGVSKWAAVENIIKRNS